MGPYTTFLQPGLHSATLQHTALSISLFLFYLKLINRSHLFLFASKDNDLAPHKPDRSNEWPSSVAVLTVQFPACANVPIHLILYRCRLLPTRNCFFPAAWLLPTPKFINTLCTSGSFRWAGRFKHCIFMFCRNLCIYLLLHISHHNYLLLYFST